MTWNKPWFYGPHWYFHPRLGGAWCAIVPFIVVIAAFVLLVEATGHILFHDSFIYFVLHS